MPTQDSLAKINRIAGNIIAKAHKTRPSMKAIAKLALEILKEALDDDRNKTSG